MAVSEVEQEVTSLAGALSDVSPVLWLIPQRVLAADLVELPPSGRELAIAALATVPALVVRRSKAIAAGTDKAQDAVIVLLEVSKCERVQAEVEEKIAALHLDPRAWIVRLGVPAMIELREYQAHHHWRNAQMLPIIAASPIACPLPAILIDRGMSNALRPLTDATGSAD